jgi:hypothetical protein
MGAPLAFRSAMQEVVHSHLENLLDVGLICNMQFEAFSLEQEAPQYRTRRQRLVDSSRRASLTPLPKHNQPCRLRLIILSLADTLCMSSAMSSYPRLRNVS